MCLLTDNYNYLNKVAFSITKERDKAKDLVSETYINLHNRNIPNVRYFVRCMRNAYTNRRSTFNKLKFKEVLTEVGSYLEQHEDSDEEKLQEIEKFKLSLPTHEQILFELCYEKNLSCRQVAEMLTTIGSYKINSKCIQRLVSPIKDKLKLQKWKSLTT